MLDKPDPEAAARFWRGLKNALNTPPDKPRRRKAKGRKRKAK